MTINKLHNLLYCCEMLLDKPAMMTVREAAEHKKDCIETLPKLREAIAYIRQQSHYRPGGRVVSIP